MLSSFYPVLQERTLTPQVSYLLNDVTTIQHTNSVLYYIIQVGEVQKIACTCFGQNQSCEMKMDKYEAQADSSRCQQGV